MTFCVVASSADRSWSGRGHDKSKAPTGAARSRLSCQLQSNPSRKNNIHGLHLLRHWSRHEDKVIAAVDVLDGIVQVGLLPQVWRSRLGHRRWWVLLVPQSMGAERQQAFWSLVPWFKHLQKGVADYKHCSVFYGGVAMSTFSLSSSSLLTAVFLASLIFRSSSPVVMVWTF